MGIGDIYRMVPIIGFDHKAQLIIGDDSMKKNYDAKMKESIAKRCLDGEWVPIVSLLFNTKHMTFLRI